MVDEMFEAVGHVMSDPKVKGLVVTGGGKLFSTGANLALIHKYQVEGSPFWFDTQTNPWLLS